MKNKYFNQLSNILHRTRPRLEKSHGLEYKICFGAVAGYVKGRIFVTCGKFGLALKLPPIIISRLINETGVKHLKYFKKGHIKKDYVVIPSRMIKLVRFKKILNESIRFVTG